MLRRAHVLLTRVLRFHGRARQMRARSKRKRRGGKIPRVNSPREYNVKFSRLFVCDLIQNGYSKRDNWWIDWFDFEVKRKFWKRFDPFQEINLIGANNSVYFNFTFLTKFSLSLSNREWKNVSLTFLFVLTLLAPGRYITGTYVYSRRWNDNLIS